MRFTISKLASLASLASLTGLAYADLATDCLDAGGFTEVTLSSPNDVIESVLTSATCPSENAVLNAPRSINFIISPTEAGTTAKIFTNSANLVTPSLAGGTLQFLWKTDLLATETSAGIILKIPRDQLTSVTTGGTGDVVTIEDGFTSLSSIYVSGVLNIIEAVTSSTTQPLTYTDSGISNSATIEAIDVSLVITGTNNNAKIKGAVSNVVMSGTRGTVLVEGDVTKVVANGILNSISINGNNGCAGFPADGGSGISDTCSNSTQTVAVSGTQSCTSSTQNSVCTSKFSSSGSSTSSSCTCDTPGGGGSGGGGSGSGGSAAARMDGVVVAMVSGVTAVVSYLLF
jgi:hypothetical protein